MWSVRDCTRTCSVCYNPPTNFSLLPSSGPPSTQPTAPLPQPISTAPAPAPLAFNPFHTSYAPLYHVTDFYEHPKGYAQLQQPIGSLHRQTLQPADVEMSSPTHTSSSIDHYGLLQPPSPRDVPMGTLPSDHLPFRDTKPVDYMSYRETLQWLYDTAGTPAAKEKALTATATMLPIPVHHHHQTPSSLPPNAAASAVGDTRWHSQPGTPRPLQMKEEILFIIHNPHWACSPPASPQRDQPPLKIFPQTTPPHQEDTTFHPLVRTPRHQPKPWNPQYREASKNI